MSIWINSKEEGLLMLDKWVNWQSGGVIICYLSVDISSNDPPIVSQVRLISFVIKYFSQIAPMFSGNFTSI